MKTLLTLLILFAATPAWAVDEPVGADARWNDLHQAIFGDRVIQDGGDKIRLAAPARALDAALVPIAVTLMDGQPVKSVYLVVDNNPSPLAAHLTFGPAADTRELTLRIRVDQYTPIHAVAEMADGKLYGTAAFVKAAGGCSAPAGSDDEAALRDIGHMKLRFAGRYAPGKPLQAQLLIRHPNFNGMQMNQVTRNYTPAWFARTTDVTFEGKSVFHLESDITLSTDPAIGFGFIPAGPGRLTVTVRDSKDISYKRTFDVPGPAS
ncbi:MAG: sulfur oxidation protein SoxZ [Rhodospirillales bacterium]|nr:sulfur oxidation protein SoxZ [Rhodospirillales bacterium]